MRNSFLDKFLPNLQSGLFFLLVFLSLFFFAGHVFFYQEKTSIFIFSIDFLIENLKRPGSLLVYVSKFLNSFYYYPITGALIASLTIWLIVYILRVITIYITGSERVLIPFLAGIALFYLQFDYRFMLYNNIGILLQLLFFLFSIKYLKGFLPVILSPVLYFLTGGFTWIFLIMYSLWLLITRPAKWLLTIPSLWLINFLIIWISKEFLFFLSTDTLLQFPYSAEGTGSQNKIFLAVVVIISLLPLLKKIPLKGHLRKKLSQNFISIFGFVLLLIIFTAISFLRHDRKTMQYFHVEKIFYKGLYQEVIDYNLKHPSNNILTLFLNNVALCETGQLNELLFHFRQSSDGGTLFLKWDIAGEISRRGGYFYYTIGMINEVHRWAYENMVTRGLTPEGLKLIIKSEIINYNYKTAKKYINILKRTLFYRSEALELESLLFNDQAVNAHPELGEKLRNKILTDFISIAENPVINIERILATDSLNRKAYEYKLAWLLLKKDYRSISYEWPNLHKYDFTKIPAHIEEAAVAIKILYTGELPQPGNLVINPDTEVRFERFLQTFQAYGNNLKAAEPALRKQFGNTFWYWTFYH